MRGPTVKNLFNVTQKLIQEQRLENSGASKLGNNSMEKLSLVNDEETNNL